MSDFQGIPVQITHEPMGFQVGQGPDGRGWMRRMRAARGVIRGLDGSGEPVKAWIGGNPASTRAFLVRQHNADGTPDEEKLALGFDSPEEAAHTILRHYPEGSRTHDTLEELESSAEDWIADREAWHHTAREHHGAPHTHKGPIAFLGRHRLPVEEVPAEEVTEDVAKAEHVAVQPGDRWITVHPNGAGSKGQAVLLRPVKGHPGVHRVVGGAGGKLNFLRITLTKSPEDYKKEAIERRAAAQKAEKERKAKLTPEERQAEKDAKAQEKAARTHAEEDFIRKVLGDDTQEGKTPDLFQEGEDQDPKAAMAYHRERLKQAFQACKEAERRITLDAEARVSSGLAQVGGAMTPGLAMDAILTQKDDKGPGYDRAISERAAANGLTADKLADATAAWKEAQGQLSKEPTKPGAPKAEEATDAAAQAHIATKELQAQKAAAIREAVKEALQNGGAIKEMLQARAELRAAYQKAVEAKTGRTFPQGFIATASEPSPEDHEKLVSNLTDAVLQKSVAGFLDEVERSNPETDGLHGAWTPQEEEGMHAARGSAAWSHIHEAGLAIFGQGLIDRDTVEALGPEAASQVMARAIRARFTHEEQQTILEALEGQHLSEQQEQLPKVTAEAQALRAEAAQLQVDMLETPRDFAAAAEMQRAKVEALRQARTVLGAALGRFEAQASIIAALQSAPAKSLEVSLGRITPERAIQTAAAMGLPPGSYQMDHTAGEAVLTIPQDGMDKLIRPVDSAAVAERELAVAIKRGELDQEGYLPAGFADRSAARYTNPLTDPPVFQRKIDLGPEASPQELEASLRGYIGGRWADGHKGTDINADIRGAWIRDEVPPHLHSELDKMVDKLVPTHELVKGPDGEPVQAMHDGKPVFDTAGKPVYVTQSRAPKDIEASIAALGREHLDSGVPGANLTLEGQTVDTNHPDFREAVHRALANDPRLQAAYAGPGEMTSVQQAAIRAWYYQEHHGKLGAQLVESINALGPEPAQFDETTGGLGLFEDLGQLENPAYTLWHQKKAELEAKLFPGNGESPWGRHVRNLGGLKRATEAIQDEMRGRFSEHFHKEYGRLTGRQLQLGTGDIAHYEAHLKSVSTPAEAEKLEAERKAKQAKMQKQGGGQFKSVNTKDKMEQASQAALFGQGGALFGMDELEGQGGGDEPPAWQAPEVAPGERMTLGSRLESQIAQAMPYSAAPFQDKGFRPVKVAEGVSMNGNFAAQQRGIHMITRLGRGGLFYGAGSGKTAVMMGGATELFHQGKAHKTIMAVPSIVQAQFGAEAVNFLDPNGAYRVHANPGESFDERLAAYRDPGKHAVVVTHQALRDDSIKLLAQHKGMSEDEATRWASDADPDALRHGLDAAFKAHGIDFQALMVDEGHDALNRKGKPDSLLAKVIDSHGHNAPYYVGATGSPVKNDASEAFDWLHKIDPQRYPKDGRDEFLRRFGGDAAITRRSLKAELSRYFFAERVDPGVQAHHSDHTVDLDAEQHDRVQAIERAASKLRLGDDPVKWARELAPERFSGRPEAEHAQIADGVRKAVGTFKESALDRAINIGGAKAKHALQIAMDRVGEGKPTVIFAHRLEGVDAMHKALEAAGIRVTSLTGRDSSAEKAKKLAAFQGADPTADVIVLSDAAATGANLQRGKVLIHMDQPMTYMVHEQRTARIHRLKQTQDVEVVNMLANHEHDRRARERVKRKQVLAGIYQGKEGYLDDSGLAEQLREIRARSAQAQVA